MPPSHVPERPPQHASRGQPERTKSVDRRSLNVTDRPTSDFRTQLDNYANALNRNFRDAIDGIETEVRVNLDDEVKKYEDACKTLEEAEWPLQMSFAKEELEIEDPNTKGRTISVPLSQRVDDFCKEMEDKSERIQQLWREWSEVQYDIICLGVEIFGKESFEIDLHNTPANALRMIDDAHARHESSSQQDQEACAKLSELQAAIQELSRKSTEESQQQLSDLKVGKQKKAAVISAAMKAMEEM